MRVNPFDTAMTLDDLAAVVAPGLVGIVLPKANDAQDVSRLAHYLDAFEMKAGVEAGQVKILSMPTSAIPKAWRQVVAALGATVSSAVSPSIPIRLKPSIAASRRPTRTWRMPGGWSRHLPTGRTPAPSASTARCTIFRI